MDVLEFIGLEVPKDSPMGNRGEEGEGGLGTDGGVLTVQVLVELKCFKYFI
jgi:hypothetical protein